MNPISSNTAAAPITKPKRLNAVPDVIRLEILKGLGVNSLCNMAACNKSWHKSVNPLWNQWANKLRIRIVNPANVKAEVIAYWKVLPEINEKLEAVGVKSQIKDPFAQNLALQTLIKEKLLNETTNKQLSDNTKEVICNTNYIPPLNLRSHTLCLQTLLDLGITPFQQSELTWNASQWAPAIYHVDYPQGFEQYFLGQETASKSGFGGPNSVVYFITLLSKSILHGNTSFIKFLLERISKSPPIDGKPIDWASLYIKSWFAAIREGLDFNNTNVGSLMALFDKYHTLSGPEKLKLFEDADWHRRWLEKEIKELEDDPTIEGARREDLPFRKEDLATANKGLAFLREHFLPKK